MAINLRTLHPIQYVGRAQHHQAIREIGAEKIFRSNKANHVFLLAYDDGTHEIDWEFCLFEATDYQLEELLKGFITLPGKEGGRLIGADGHLIQFPDKSEDSARGLNTDLLIVPDEDDPELNREDYYDSKYLRPEGE